MTSTWISVRERLPKGGDRVIAYLPGPPEEMYLGIFIGCFARPVTHWMPAPDPPPALDPFEEFAREHNWAPNPDHIAIDKKDGTIATISRRGAKIIWDAAIASTKKG